MNLLGKAEFLGAPTPVGHICVHALCANTLVSKVCLCYSYCTRRPFCRYCPFLCSYWQFLFLNLLTQLPLKPGHCFASVFLSLVRLLENSP